jgi:hypothetical protein
MKHIRFSKLLYVLLLFVLVACQAQATSVPTVVPLPATAVPPTSIPPTQVTPTATQIPTAKPLDAPVIAEWKVSNPSGVYIGFDSVWIPGHHDSTTTRIDPASNKVIAVIQGTGDHAEQALAVGDVLWVTGQLNDTTWIDPKTNTVPTTVPRVEGHLHYIAYGFNSLWITTRDNKLDRVDPATSQIIASIPYADGIAGCQGFVFASTTAIWVDQCDHAELIKVDPATNSVVSKTPYATLIDEAKAQTTVPAGKGTDFIWVSNVGGLLRIDSKTGAGLTFLPLSPVQSGDGFLAVTDEAIWFGGLGQINRVNVATNQIDATYTTDPGSIIHLAIGFGSVWLENYELNLVQRLDIAP